MSYEEALVYLYRVLRWSCWKIHHERLCRAIEIVLDKLSRDAHDSSEFNP